MICKEALKEFPPTFLEAESVGRLLPSYSPSSPYFLSKGLDANAEVVVVVGLSPTGFLLAKRIINNRERNQANISQYFFFFGQIIIFVHIKNLDIDIILNFELFFLLLYQFFF